MNKMNKKKYTILLVDDHPIVRDGLTQLIKHEQDLQVIGEAENAAKAMHLIVQLNPDIIIVDISLNGSNGIELIKAVRTRFPMIFVLVYSMYDEKLYVERVLRAGAMGYVMKHEPSEKVIEAIRQIINGDIYLSDEMSKKIIKKIIYSRSEAAEYPVESLTDRELEVFQLLGRGVGTRQISEELNLTISTIETHRKHIKEKLNIYNSNELIQYAVQWVQGINR